MAKNDYRSAAAGDEPAHLSVVSAHHYQERIQVDLEGGARGLLLLFRLPTSGEIHESSCVSDAARPALRCPALRCAALCPGIAWNAIVDHITQAGEPFDEFLPPPLFPSATRLSWTGRAVHSALPGPSACLRSGLRRLLPG